MTRLIRRFLNDEGGATAIEYGLICGLIFLVIVGSVTLMSSKVTATFAKVASAVASAGG
ncbi:Flp family type IVb pilin [Brevundimonas staleyi]|uniref:Flp family type IVb pilin n=1 Tax=Brevundimonas staleyi TaxID=74326 RepID=A0ABW0FXG0_9CAUL